MAITAISTTYTTSGPAFTNQVIALGGRDAAEIAYHGVFNFTGDGSSTSATFNWIDGVQTPFFTQGNPPVAVAPKAVLLGSLTSVAAGSTLAINVSALSTTGCVLTFSAAPSAVAYTLPFVIFPYTT
jgi:hypothetical protein